MMLDDKDWNLLNALKDNAKLSSQKLSKLTGIPISTVHHRLRRMEKQGVIKKYTIVLDQRKLPVIAAYILVNVDYHPPDGSEVDQHDMVKRINKIQGVEEVSMVTGATDIMIKVLVNNMEELNHFITKKIRSFRGIEKTQTLIVLNTSEK